MALDLQLEKRRETNDPMSIKVKLMVILDHYCLAVVIYEGEVRGGRTEGRRGGRGRDFKEEDKIWF